MQINTELPLGENFEYLLPWHASSMAPRRNVVSEMVPSMISTSGVDEVADGDGVCSVDDAGSGRSSEGVLLTSSSVGDASFFFHVASSEETFLGVAGAECSVGRGRANFFNLS